MDPLGLTWVDFWLYLTSVDQSHITDHRAKLHYWAPQTPWGI